MMSTSDRTAASTFDRVAADLSHAPFPAMAAAIRARTERVLKHWRELSLKAMPHLDELTLEQFEDTIAEILSAAADMLTSADPEQLRGVIESGPQHGIDRFIQDYSLLDLFEEVRILRGLVIVEIAEAMERPLETDEAATFHAIFDIIIQQGVIALTDKQNELLCQTTETLREMNERLLVSSVRQQELTEQARSAEAAMRDSEEFSRAVLESSPDCVKILATDGRLLAMNTTGLCLLEIDNFPEFYGKQWGSLWPAESREQITSALVAVNLGRTHRFQAFSPTAKGTPKWWDVMVAPVRNRDGCIVRIVSVSRDITEIKRSEKALRDSEDRFRSMADNISQLAWTCDKLGEVIWFNQRWLDYTGLSFEEMQGWGWKQCLHPDHVDHVAASMQHSRDFGEPWEDTFPLGGKDGEYRWFLSHARPIRNEQGELLRWFGTNTDITEQRDLERKIADQAGLLADESRRKDEFLAMLGHELRNPLAPIRNAVLFLDMQDVPEADAAEAREVIGRQVDVMVRLVDDLLDVSRISRNQLELRKQRVDLAVIVKNAVESSRPLIAQFRHELTVSLPRQPVPLEADAVRLAQVFLNLLNNAAKYTPPGGHIWLTAQMEGSQAVVSVRDNGIGIPADMLARVFDMFTQVDRSLTHSQGGLGIGLTLVRRLVEMHDGRVDVRSPGVEQGSEFIVRLPLAAQPNQEQQDAGVSPRAQALSHLRILVVDDNKDSADSLAMVLRRQENDIRVAYDGLEAMNAAEEFRPELVLLDIGLPKLNGYEVARRIRQQPWGRDIIIVALTGWGQDEDRRRSQEAGFDLHIVKPVELIALESLLADSQAKQNDLKE